MKLWNVICTRPCVRPSQGVWGGEVMGGLPRFWVMTGPGSHSSPHSVWFLDRLIRPGLMDRGSRANQLELRGCGHSLIWKGGFVDVTKSRILR